MWEEISKQQLTNHNVAHRHTHTNLHEMTQLTDFKNLPRCKQDTLIIMNITVIREALYVIPIF